MEAIGNQDYLGVRVRDPNAPWHKQAEQIGEFVAKGFLPISVSQAQKAKANEAGPGRYAAGFFGVTNAPASVSRSAFQSFVAEKAYASMPRGARTTEQAEHSQQMHDVEEAMRRGRKADTDGLTPNDIKAATKAADKDVPELRFARLSIQDKLEAYELATPEERQRYHLRATLQAWQPERSETFMRLPIEQRRALLERRRQLMAQ